MKKLKYILILLMFSTLLSSCNVYLMDANKYDKVLIDGQLHSQYQNCVEMWSIGKDRYEFIFIQKGEVYNTIKVVEGSNYTRDKTRHYVFDDIEGNYTIDATKDEIVLFSNTNGSRITYKDKKCP